MTVVQGAMPRAPSENISQVVIRIPEAWVERADELIAWIARPGVAATRTDVLRAALAKGLDALEVERHAETKKSPKK